MIVSIDWIDCGRTSESIDDVGTANGLDPKDHADTKEDLDEDIRTNSQEYLEGTL